VNRTVLDRHEQLTRAVAQQQIEAAGLATGKIEGTEQERYLRTELEEINRENKTGSVQTDRENE
jgi:hypothetical protein